MLSLFEKQEEGDVQMNLKFSGQGVSPVTGSSQPSNEAIGLTGVLKQAAHLEKGQCPLP